MLLRLRYNGPSLQVSGLHLFCKPEPLPFRPARFPVTLGGPMDPAPDRQLVTQLLQQWGGGDKQALEQLMPIDYEQLLPWYMKPICG